MGGARRSDDGRGEDLKRREKRKRTVLNTGPRSYIRAINKSRNRRVVRKSREEVLCYIAFSHSLNIFQPLKIAVTL